MTNEIKKYVLTVKYVERPKISNQEVYAYNLQDAKQFAVKKFLDQRSDNPEVIEVLEHGDE